MIQINKAIKSLSAGDYNFTTLKSYEKPESNSMKEFSTLSCCTPAIYAIIIFALAILIKKISTKNGFTIQIKHE